MLGECALHGCGHDCLPSAAMHKIRLLRHHQVEEHLAF